MGDIERGSIEQFRESLSAPEEADRHAAGAPVATQSSGGGSRVVILAAFAAVYLIWGSTYLAIKYAIETLPPFLMAGTRFLVAGALLYAWARWRGQKSADDEAAERPRPAQWRAAVIVGGLLLLCGNGGVVWAERYIASGLAALLVATEPLWIVLLNWTRPGGVRPNAKVALGLLTGFAGMLLLVGPGLNGSSDSGGVNLFGAGLVVAAAFAWAAGSLYSLRAPAHRSALVASGMQMLAGGTLLMIASLLAGEWTRFDLNRASARSVIALLYLVVFGSIIAFTAYGWLLRTVTPARVATYAYVNPIVAVVLGWALASEPLTGRTLLAAGVIVASVALITTYGKEGGAKRMDNARPRVEDKKDAEG